MIKIGDFARLSQVSVVTLRYYDEVDLLKPVKVDTFTGYRFYSADQLPRLNRILALKDLGFSLDQIKLMLADGLTSDQLRGMLTIQRNEVEKRLADEQAAREQDEQRHTSAIQQASARLAEHQQQADARAGQAANSLSALQAKLVEQAAVLLETERKANADRHGAAEHATQRQAKFDTELAQEVARRQTLAARLTESEAAQQERQHRAGKRPQCHDRHDRRADGQPDEPVVRPVVVQAEGLPQHDARDAQDAQ